jgi:predicted lysophospholipase L1 biosynthesis ABC-type transport system permease subunit
MITAATALNANIAVPQVLPEIRALPLATAVALAGEALLAAALPAWRAAHQAAAGDRGRDQEQQGSQGASLWLMRFTVFTAAIFAIAMEVSSRSATWGLLAGLLIALATALAARPLIDLLGSALSFCFHRFAGAAGRLAVAHVARSPRRAGLMVAMIGVGIGFACCGCESGRAALSSLSLKP